MEPLRLKRIVRKVETSDRELRMTFAVVFLIGAVVGFGLGWATTRTETIVVRDTVADNPAALSSVNLMISDGTLVRTWNTVTWEETMTPYDLLEKVAHARMITMEPRDLGGGQLGIARIDDAPGTTTPTLRWQYWVNNTYEPRAANKYSLKPGDHVTWILAEEPR